MKNHIKSKLISSGVFAASASILFLTALMNIDGEIVWAIGVVIPMFLFLFFWTYRSILKARGDWHSSGTAWLIFLMMLLGIWGFYYYFFASFSAPLKGPAFLSTPLTTFYLIGEGVIAIFSWFYRLLEKRFSTPAA